MPWALVMARLVAQSKILSTALDDGEPVAVELIAEVRPFAISSRPAGGGGDVCAQSCMMDASGVIRVTNEGTHYTRLYCSGRYHARYTDMHFSSSRVDVCHG